MKVHTSPWKKFVNPCISAESSLILRYARILELTGLADEIDISDLQAASIAEGAKIFPLAVYKGVEIFVNDESSHMATGTYKDLDACLICALARRAGHKDVVVSSGGNLGYAMAKYAEKAGLRVFVFHPMSTLFKLDRATFGSSATRLISVDLPERQVKALASGFARCYGLPLVPEIRWRLAASAPRAVFLLESSSSSGLAFDCIAQTMCAGYGPVGIYDCFMEMMRRGMLRRSQIPRFLGFQQESNSPMVRAWTTGERSIDQSHINATPSAYIEPGLYNTNPDQNYTRLFDLMRCFGGDLMALGHDDYRRYRNRVLDWFECANMHITRHPDTDEIMEKTGVMTGVGIVKAIEEGHVSPGERILYMLTGGFRKMATWEPAQPDFVMDASRTESEWIEELGRSCDLPMGRSGQIGASFSSAQLDVSTQLFQP
jgi:threonine synthase